MTWQQTNQAYWDSHNTDYPFQAIQTEHITASYTKPEHLTTNRHGEFLRVPTGAKVLWGFRRAADRDAFLADFGGAVHTTGETP